MFQKNKDIALSFSLALSILSSQRPNDLSQTSVVGTLSHTGCQTQLLVCLGSTLTYGPSFLIIQIYTGVLLHCLLAGEIYMESQYL